IFAVSLSAFSAQSVDEASLAVTRVTLFKGAKPISVGSGFYFVRKEPNDRVIVFLVTNQHVLTGRAITESGPPKGDTIGILCHTNLAIPSEVSEVRLPLFTSVRKRLWLINDNVPTADVAVLPIPERYGQQCKFAGLTEEAAQGRLMLRPGSTVTLIGYPYGF